MKTTILKCDGCGVLIDEKCPGATVTWGLDYDLCTGCVIVLVKRGMQLRTDAGRELRTKCNNCDGTGKALVENGNTIGSQTAYNTIVCPECKF